MMFVNLNKDAILAKYLYAKTINANKVLSNLICIKCLKILFYSNITQINKKRTVTRK